ncbi:MAG: hypothetical protein J1E35_05115 [Lachnospiraceae bacterium]|nr:hypothetical protein [Lachnospiraceae bacterium]
MLESMQKKFIKQTLLAGLFLFAVAGVIIVFAGRYILAALFGYKDISELDPQNLKKQPVKIEITDCSSFYLGNSSSSTHYYYTQVETTDGYRFISLKVGNNSKLLSSLSDLAKSNGRKSLTLYGHLEPMADGESGAFEARMESKVKAALKSMYGDQEIDVDSVMDELVEKISVPYHLAVVDKTQNAVIAYIVLAFVLLLTVLPLINIIKAVTGASLNDLKEEFSKAGTTESLVEADYNTAVSFKKKDTLRIGNQFLHYTTGYTPHILPADHLVWVYQRTTEHRRNGITVSKTYSLLLTTDGFSKPITLDMSKEESSQKALSEITRRFPWVIVGYTDELKRMYEKDREAFLNLRFHTVEHSPYDPNAQAWAAPEEQRPE